LHVVYVRILMVQKFHTKLLIFLKKKTIKIKKKTTTTKKKTRDSVAQWIRRWSTEPEILGSIPSGVVLFLSSENYFNFF
jgi:hypothetical protein